MSFGSNPPPSLAGVLAPELARRASAMAAHESNKNVLGRKIAEIYTASSNNKPGGACFEVGYARVKEAANQVGVPLPALNNSSNFGRLWGSYIDPRKSWLNLPYQYRGKGAAGAMEYAGLGTLVETEGIWNGQLQPGAVIQTWRLSGDLSTVRDGNKPASYGHSFIFLNYVYSGDQISAMEIADQGFQSGSPLPRSKYAYWVGANHNSGVKPVIF